MSKLKRKFRRLSLYKKSLLLFTSVLLVLGIIFLVYVWNSMVIYERSLVDNYIKYLVVNGKLTNDISNDLFTVSTYEKKNAKITDGVKKIFKSDNLVIKKNSKESSNDTYVYDLKLNDNVISTVSLKNTNTYTKMAILQINEWKVESIKTNFNNGIYTYTITIPENYKLYINDLEVSEDLITSSGDVKGLDRLTKYIEISKSNTYEINNLVYEPKIKILDDNKKEVKYTITNGNEINVIKEFIEVNTLEDAKEYLKEDLDIMSLAENWSLFLTDDLSGSYHGFNQLTPYLIEDSYMYEMAYGWSHQVDITFVSSHRLKNPVFTNESLKNFVIYNDLSFSCEVYLEKNMVVSGKDKVDVMHDRLYFIYYEGSYKLVDMQSI